MVLFSSLPLIFPSTVLGNITASVALILWTNGQLPPPIKELWEGLKKLAPHHFSPGASCEHSRGRKIFGLLNCFYASIVSLILSLSLSRTGYSLPTRWGAGCPKIRCGHCISWGSRLGWKGVPAPSSAIAMMCQHPLGLPSLRI